MENIRECRIRHGLTQKQVSEMTGIPVRTLQDWESGRRNPPAWTVAMVIEKIEREVE